MAFFNDSPDLIQKQEIISHLRNIKRVIQPRHRIQKLKTLLEESNRLDFKKILDPIKRHSGNACIFIKSLEICQKKDAEKAALEGIPLKFDTLVDDHFTHEASLQLHLGMLATIKKEGGGYWDKVAAQDIWEEMLNSIPEVKPIFLDWFSENKGLLRKDPQRDVVLNLMCCDTTVKQLPGYNKACESVYGVIGSD